VEKEATAKRATSRSSIICKCCHHHNFACVLIDCLNIRFLNLRARWESNATLVTEMLCGIHIPVGGRWAKTGGAEWANLSGSPRLPAIQPSIVPSKSSPNIATSLAYTVDSNYRWCLTIILNTKDEMSVSRLIIVRSTTPVSYVLMESESGLSTIL
jgi:hypothetical protein